MGDDVTHWRGARGRLCGPGAGSSATGFPEEVDCPECLDAAPDVLFEALGLTASDLRQRSRESRKVTEARLPGLGDCVAGRVYRLRCRNLRLGVFDGVDGFIGIREKFGSRYLFTEYHRERGQHGTVLAADDTGVDVPADVLVAESTGTFCATTGRPLEYCPDDSNPHVKGRAGWWRYADTGEPAPSVEGGTRARERGNQELLNFLKQIEENGEV